MLEWENFESPKLADGGTIVKTTKLISFLLFLSAGTKLGMYEKKEQKYRSSLIESSKCMLAFQ